jgi:hypothetical protein
VSLFSKNKSQAYRKHCVGWHNGGAAASTPNHPPPPPGFEPIPLLAASSLGTAVHDDDDGSFVPVPLIASFTACSLGTAVHDDNDGSFVPRPSPRLLRWLLPQNRRTQRRRRRASFPVPLLARNRYDDGGPRASSPSRPSPRFLCCIFPRNRRSRGQRCWATCPASSRPSLRLLRCLIPLNCRTRRRRRRASWPVPLLASCSACSLGTAVHDDDDGRLRAPSLSFPPPLPPHPEPP